MSQALERVIAEQQEKIDWYKQAVESHSNAWARNYEMVEKMEHLLFRAMHLDYNDKEAHRRTKSAIREFMLDEHICLQCERRICECEYDD
jgi:leucyl aminopeptidase (aminopeptidase T)